MFCFLPSCDWNIYNIRYATALSKQRGMKRTAAESLSDEEESSEAMDSAGDEENMMNEPVIENWNADHKHFNWNFTEPAHHPNKWKAGQG